MRHHPGCALLQDQIQILVRDAHVSAASRAGRHVTKELVDKVTDLRGHVLDHECAGKQPDAAIDVEAHAAWRHHSALFGQRCRYSADGKPVALMDIRHGEGTADNAGQHGNVRRLLQTLIAQHVAQQALVTVDKGVSEHAGTCLSRYDPAVVIELLELVQFDGHEVRVAI